MAYDDGSGVVALYGGGSGNNKVKVVDASSKPPAATFSMKVGLAQMLRGGVIMDVVTPEQARIAEEAGACAVMALERVPADIRSQGGVGGVARMSDPGLIRDIKRAVTIPVMAKARIGHFVEAQILEAIGVDYVDESEVLTLADDAHHMYINKHNFRIPFVCGRRDLGEALRRHDQHQGQGHRLGVADDDVAGVDDGARWRRWRAGGGRRREEKGKRRGKKRKMKKTVGPTDEGGD
ncbi:hypothetical protein EJB05_34774, partial [Eragrostis curvula]